MSELCEAVVVLLLSLSYTLRTCFGALLRVYETSVLTRLLLDSAILNIHERQGKCAQDYDRMLISCYGVHEL